MGPEGVEHVEAFPDAVKAALKETSLAGATIYIGGAASNNKDIKEYAASDLTIVAIAAFVLIFVIMLVLTRSLMAAIVIPGTVAFSFAGAFGLSILVWQHLIGLHLHWLVLPITFVILVAVGSDYNLLLIARVKEEIGTGMQRAGLHTALIRALGSTGGVVTSAGLVFAFTMLAMLSSDLKTIAQVGSTVCIGLLLDTLIVRALKPGALVGYRLARHALRCPEILRGLPQNAVTARVPVSYATIGYHALHAFRWISADGGSRFVRYHWIPVAGEQFLSFPAARSKGADFLTDELSTRLTAGPIRFDLEVQIAGPDDSTIDPSAPWASTQTATVGTLEITGLDTEREHDGDIVVFDPMRVTDGVEPSDDPVLHFRSYAYSVSVKERSGVSRGAEAP
jgi:hypothetical protein